MRKSAIVLLLVIVLTLSACKPVEDEYITYANEADNTKEQLVQLIGQILLKTELLLPVEETPNIIEVEYPFFKSDFTYVNTTDIIDQVSFSSAVVLHTSLAAIRNDLSSSGSYEEDTWKEVYDSNKKIVFQYRIYMNDDSIVLQHYRVDDQDKIIGYHVYISLMDDKLEYIMNSIDYFYNDDVYANGQQSYFKENDIYSEKSLLSKGDQHFEIGYMEYDFFEDNYKKIYLKDIDNTLHIREVEYFNSSDNVHVEYIDKSNALHSTTITEYDSLGEKVFKTKGEQGYFTFEFNLKYVHGWDKIENWYSLNDLYTLSNEDLVLPQGVYTIIHPEEGIFITGNLLQVDIETKFNLENSGLVGPVEYDTFLRIQDDFEDRADDIKFNILENEMSDIDDLYDDILHYLYEEEFHGMCKDLIK